MTDDELSALRVARREAWNAFYANPSEKTKASYLTAQSKYGAALYRVAEPSTRSRGSWGNGPPPELAEELNEARLAENAARQAMYANPSPESKEVMRLARNHYQNLRRKLDPEFRAKSDAATRRWHENNKAKRIQAD